MPIDPQSANNPAAALRYRLLTNIEQFDVIDKVMLGKALSLAEDTHSGQTRRQRRSNPQQNLPYIVHPMRVALLIMEELDLKEPIAVATALLHDTVELSAGRVTISYLEEKFNQPIAMMVSILTKPALKESMSQAEKDQRLNIYRERLVNSSVESRLVKLADRLDNTREAADLLDKGFQQRYLEETRSFYLPMSDNTDAYLFEQLAKACDKLENQLKFA